MPHLDRKWWFLMGAIVSGYLAIWWFSMPLTTFGLRVQLEVARDHPFDTAAFIVLSLTAMLLVRRFVLEHLAAHQGKTVAVKPIVLELLVFGLLAPLATIKAEMTNLTYEVHNDHLVAVFLFALMVVAVGLFATFLKDIVTYNRDHDGVITQRALVPTT